MKVKENGEEFGLSFLAINLVISNHHDSLSVDAVIISHRLIHSTNSSKSLEDLLIEIP